MSFFFGFKTLAAMTQALLLCRFYDFDGVSSRHATPARFAMRLRLVIRIVALVTFAPALYFPNPDDFSVDATPTAFAVPLRFFRSFVALTAAPLTFLNGCQD
jgi:hypothetical protein